MKRLRVREFNCDAFRVPSSHCGEGWMPDEVEMWQKVGGGGHLIHSSAIRTIMSYFMLDCGEKTEA